MAAGDTQEAPAGGEGTYVDSGWRIHPTPDGRRLMMPHDKNSLHMDGCITLYVRRDHMEARGVVLDSMPPPAASSSAFGSEVVGGEVDGPSAEDRQQRVECPQPPTTADAARGDQ